MISLYDCSESTTCAGCCVGAVAATTPFAPTWQPEHFGTGVRAARPQKLLG